jgi:UPF0755 protein
VKRKAAAVGLGLALASLLVYHAAFSAVRLAAPVEVRVERGMSFRQAALRMKESGVVRYALPLVVAARATGLDDRLRPGYYSFGGDTTPWGVFRALSEGRVVEAVVTVIEGDSLHEVKGKLSERGLVSTADFDRLAHDSAFLARLSVEATSLEGYLFPDTYRFYKGAEPEEVLGAMVRRLREQYAGDLPSRARLMGLSEREVLTLASIIEKEARSEAERPLVSAVYHNRLRRGIPLQADPTAIYGIKPQCEGVTLEDVRRKTAYNTYFIKGLPPGPIASPGLASIKAALYPAEAPYLYFVASGDGTTHTFSATLKEHERAVRKYRLARAQAGG